MDEVQVCIDSAVKEIAEEIDDESDSERIDRLKDRREKLEGDCSTFRDKAKECLGEVEFGDGLYWSDLKYYFVECKKAAKRNRGASRGVQTARQRKRQEERRQQDKEQGVQGSDKQDGKQDGKGESLIASSYYQPSTVSAGKVIIGSLRVS